MTVRKNVLLKNKGSTFFIQIKQNWTAARATTFIWFSFSQSVKKEKIDQQEMKIWPFLVHTKVPHSQHSKALCPKVKLYFTSLVLTQFPRRFTTCDRSNTVCPHSSKSSHFPTYLTSSRGRSRRSQRILAAGLEPQERQVTKTVLPATIDSPFMSTITAFVGRTEKKKIKRWNDCNKVNRKKRTWSYLFLFSTYN